MRIRAPTAISRSARGPSSVFRRSSVQQRQAAAPDLSAQAAVAAYKNTDTSIYRNADGMRVNDGRYTRFKQDMRGILGEDRVVDDPVRTFAFGVDASFYRLNPQVVVRVKDENEVVDTLTVARRHQTPVTFRAAGTSLSGQAITDSVLMKISLSQ